MAIISRSQDLPDMLNQAQQASDETTEIGNHYLSAQEISTVGDVMSITGQNAPGTSYCVGDTTALVGFCTIY